MPTLAAQEREQPALAIARTRRAVTKFDAKKDRKDPRYIYSTTPSRNSIRIAIKGCGGNALCTIKFRVAVPIVFRC